MIWRVRDALPESPTLAVGGALVGLLVLTAGLAPWLAPFDPGAAPARATATSLRPPGAPFHLGTDLLGRDVLSRVVHGARVSLAVATGSGGLAAAIGLVVGALAGLAGGVVDRVLMTAAEALRVFPATVLAIGVVVAWPGPDLDTLTWILGLTSWPVVARAVRHAVRGARGLGGRGLVGAGLGPFLHAALQVAAASMGAEAGLAFVGLGVPPPAISWGGMLAEGQPFLTGAPWVAVFPGAALVLAILGVSLLGEGIRDALAPGPGASADAAEFAWVAGRE